MNRVLGAGCAVALLGCAGLVPGPTVRATGVVTFAPADPVEGDRMRFLGDQATIASSPPVRERLAHERGPPPEALVVVAEPDPTSWQLRVRVDAPEPALANAWCQAVLEELVDRRNTSLRTALDLERERLGEEMNRAVGPQRAEVRRKLEDLSARRARTDARVTEPCAEAAATDP